MSNPLKNPYVRMGLAAVGANLIGPKIIASVIPKYNRAANAEPEITLGDDESAPLTEIDLTYVGLTACVTSAIFVALGMLVGESLATAAAAGPA